jgi:hypothetical protein
LVTSSGGGTGVAPVVTVEAEAGAVQNTGMETAYLTGTVSKYSGMNTLSVELLERSDPNFYAELTKQLEYAYLKTLDTTVLTALLAAGMNGTNTSADLDGIVAFTTEGARTIYSNTGYFAQNYIANPAQWGALIGAQDTTKRPVFNALQPMNAGGQVNPTSIRGNVLGLDLYVDKNFSATTFDDDSAVILAPEAFTVYRSPQAFMSVNVVSNLQVQNNVATLMLASPGMFTTGQQITVTNCGSPYNGTNTITGTFPYTTGTTNLLPAIYWNWATINFPNGYSFVQFAETAADENFHLILPYGNARGPEHKSQSYASTPAIREAAMIVAVDIWQARQVSQTGGVGMDGVSASPYRMGYQLINRVRGLIQPYSSPASLVG